MKKIIFKLENGMNSCEIKNINTKELLTFICDMLESLVQRDVVKRDELLSTINIYLTLGTSLTEKALENKEIQKLIKELSISMCELFRNLSDD